MKILIALALCFTSNLALGAYPAASYCSSATYKSETKFEGRLFTPNVGGKLTYLGRNQTNSENLGVFIFKSLTEFVMEFPGEQRHWCYFMQFPNWTCVMGTLHYNLQCPEWVDTP
jgi:hypothetical protein